MGSSGSKKRKPSTHLPPVGSAANQRYEMKTERKLVFGNLGIVLIVGFLVIALLGLLVITL